MTIKTIAVLVGSLRKESINRRLAQSIEALLPPGYACVYPDIGALGFFNQDLEADFPAAWREFNQTIADAAAVLVVTPEYNRGVPGVLKNAIDIASRPWGQSVWKGKPVAVCGASPGAMGTALAQASLLPVFRLLDTRLMAAPELYLHVGADTFGMDGKPSDSTTNFLQGFVDALVRHIDV